MSYPFPPDLRELVHHAMATGGFRSEDDLLRDALTTWKRRNDDLAAIREGVADMEAGRVYPLEDVFDEICERHGFEKP